MAVSGVRPKAILFRRPLRMRPISGSLAGGGRWTGHRLDQARRVHAATPPTQSRNLSPLPSTACTNLAADRALLRSHRVTGCFRRNTGLVASGYGGHPGRMGRTVPYRTIALRRRNRRHRSLKPCRYDWSPLSRRAERAGEYHPERVIRFQDSPFRSHSATLAHRRGDIVRLSHCLFHSGKKLRSVADITFIGGTHDLIAHGRERALTTDAGRPNPRR
jgi:hypothetical protein